MPIKRVFLGWDAPCLRRAAELLGQGRTVNGSVDLGGVLVVTPGARAGRRLLEILAETCSGPWLPPQFITPGELGEHLYEPSRPLASALQSQLTWMCVLRDSPDLLRTLAPQPPAPADLPNWFVLAGEIHRMLADLAAQGLNPEDVAQHGQQLADFRDEQRWDALQSLHERYLGRLADQGLADPQDELRRAIEDGRVAATRTIALLAVPELPMMLKRALREVAERVLVLVHAPPSEAEGFDDLGCLLPPMWAGRTTPVQLQMLRVADQPRDQATEVLLALAGLERLDVAQRSVEVDCRHAPDAVTVGLGDSSLGPTIQRTLELAGMPARLAVGRPLRCTRPVMLLEAMAQFFESGRLDDFASLLRHPDVEAWLVKTQAGAGIESWLALLDRYATDHLQGRAAKSWVGDAHTAAKLKEVWDAVAALAEADPKQSRSLEEWLPSISGILLALYGEQTLTRSRPDHEALIQSLEALGQALREMAQIGRLQDLPLTLPQAMKLVAAALGGKTLAPGGGQPAVELLGWLELHLDDAPNLIITGFNEGCVPASATPSGLLPDSLRRVLGLEDHARRYARDLYLLTAIIHSRPSTTLIMGRRGTQDEPLSPSRLALACDEEEVARRVAWFYGVDGQTSRTGVRVTHADTAQDSELLVPLPRPPQAPLQELRVTAFRDYLASPYRFYLKHVLGLEPLDDLAVQIKATAFGTLAHRVLQGFACRGPAQSTDAAEIQAFLDAELNATFERDFGSSAPMAALLQREQLRQRLAAFAQWQARHAAEGWRILGQDAERTIQATLDVDGQSFTITGRIDRIDEHPDKGHWLVDYKTGSDTPERTHRRGPLHAKEWVDLQLPLYRLLARQIKIKDEPKLGFIVLPTDPKKTGAKLAGWTEAELDAAVEKAKWVVRQIRAGVFWPLGEPVAPNRDDGLAGVCLDRCLQRDEVIRRISKQLAPLPGAGGGR